MFPFIFLLFVADALFSKSYTADYLVQVGVVPPTAQSGYRYLPDRITGAVAGDTITFQFLPADHTATQGTLATPCFPLAGGFDSGRKLGSRTPDAANTFQLRINNTDPIWVHCSTPGHCSSGMVFAVNPASDTQLVEFRQNAANSTTTASTATTTAITTATATITAVSTSTSITASTGFSSVKIGPVVLISAVAGTLGALLI